MTPLWYDATRLVILGIAVAAIAYALLSERRER